HFRQTHHELSHPHTHAKLCAFAANPPDFEGRPDCGPGGDYWLYRLCNGGRGSMMELSKAEIEAIKHEMTLYEDPGAATIDALKIVQDHRGWVSDEAMAAAAKVLGVSPTQ